MRSFVVALLDYRTIQEKAALTIFSDPTSRSVSCDIATVAKVVKGKNTDSTLTCPLLRFRLSDLEVADDATVERASLLASPSINDTDNQNYINSNPTTQNRRTSSVSRVSISNDAAATLSFLNINYTIGDRAKLGKQRWRFPSILAFKPSERKQILFNVSGHFVNGMNAILGRCDATFINLSWRILLDCLIGPTGCGKSSLLDILADRKDPRGRSGRILVDGSPRHPSFKYTVGYVTQEDIFTGTLTVRENLLFSANLRLPKTISSQEKLARVLRIISDLGLESCADTRMGTDFLRGVSGGEKKRTCIGMELVLSPKFLFLDEPTTGKATHSSLKDPPSA